MNILTNCLGTTAALDEAIAPLSALKKEEFAKLHAVFNARLQLWCAQFQETPMPAFDGFRGFGFDGSFKENIYSDELLVNLVVEGDTAHATFNPGGFDENIFTMSVPVRYLDAQTGEAAIVQDANDHKREMASSPSP